MRCGHVAVVLAVGVNHTGFLHCFHQFHRFLHGLHRQDFRKNMLACVHGPDGKGCVFCGEVGKYYRIHIVLQKILKIIIECDGQPCGAGFLLSQHMGSVVTDGNYFRVIGDLAVIDHTGAPVTAQNTDSDFLHRESSCCFFL